MSEFNRNTDAFVRENCPCVQDCTERSSACRLTCERWREYAEKREREYARRRNERTADSYCASEAAKTTDRSAKYRAEKHY